jgi:hypothetical protein
MQNASAGAGYLCEREYSISEHGTYGHGSEHPQVQQQKTQASGRPEFMRFLATERSRHLAKVEELDQLMKTISEEWGIEFPVTDPKRP